MSGENVDIQTADGVADAYLTRPDDGERHPGVLFIVDAFGLRPRIEEMADRIAQRGYVVLAPNVFYRAGRAPVVPLPDMTDPDGRSAFFGEIRPLMNALTPEVAAGDGAAFLSFLAEHADEPVGMTGYCMGVRYALRVAAAHPERVGAVAGFHGGGLATDASDSPHHALGSVQAELYFGHADNDGSMTAENIAELERALDEAGIEYQSVLYEGAAHGYTMSDTPVYDEAACERHFDALFELFERAL